jgi:hypothetical protein
MPVTCSNISSTDLEFKTKRLAEGPYRDLLQTDFKYIENVLKEIGQAYINENIARYLQSIDVYVVDSPSPPFPTPFSKDPRLE